MLPYFAQLYSSHPVYRQVAAELHPILQGSVCISCFSTGKDELVMQFKTTNRKFFQLLVKFIEGEMLFRFFAPEVSFGRRGLKFSADLENATVLLVSVVPNDRILLIQFNNGFQLVFKGFGRFGNVLLFENENPTPSRVFRNNIKSDTDFSLPETNSPSAENITDSATLFYVENSNPVSQLYTEAAEGRVPIGEGLAALDKFAESFIYQNLFAQEKQRIITKTERDLKHFRKLFKDNAARMELIKTRRSYREIGDIVMSYAHSIKSGVSSAFLTDYFTGNPIRVKLDPNISAAENAQKYYRKAKNEALELEHARKNYEAAKLKIEELELALNAATSAVEFKELKSGKRKVTEKEKPGNLPYKEYIFQDFVLWLGKNARSNDELLKLAGKNDLWLHAKGVAGSHVIIRKKGNSFPETVIQFAAKLAAENSKAKTQSVVPVICVERKYVSKGKNAAPGEVRVMQERIVDAFLN